MARPKAETWWMALVVLAALATGRPAFANAGDIVRVQVTQGAQGSVTNSVKLAARRAIAVRVLLSDRLKHQRVTGRLSMKKGSTALVTDVPPIVEPFTVPEAPSLDEYGGSLDFRVTDVNAIPESLVTFEVRVFDETLATQLDSKSFDLQFGPPLELRVWWVEVHLPESATVHAAPLPPDVKPGTADAFLRGVFPVADDADVANWASPRVLEFGHDFDGDGKLDKDDDKSSDPDDRDTSLLLEALENRLDCTVDPAQHPNTFLQIYGWIPEESETARRMDGFKGWSDELHAAIGTTLPEAFQATFAHEVAHGFGEDHSDDLHPPEDSIGPSAGFDPGDRLFDNPATNGLAEAWRFFKASDFGPFMLPGCTAAGSWIGVECLERILAAVPPTEWEGTCDCLTLRVRGYWPDVTRENLILSPIIKYPWRIKKRPFKLPPPPPEPKPRPSPGPDPFFEVELVYRTARIDGISADVISARAEPGGRLLVTQRERFVRRPSQACGQEDAAKDSPAPASRWSALEVGFDVPRDAEVLSVRVLEAKTAKVVAEKKRAADAAPPRIVEMQLAPSPKPETKLRATWRVEDDGPPRGITCNVAWSPDGGRRFFPLEVLVRSDSREFALEFDRRALSDQGKQCMVRVIATDGIDTAFADSENVLLH